MTVIPAVVPADPPPAPTEASAQPPAKPGFDHALKQASRKTNPRPNAKHDAKPNAKPDAKTRARDGDAANAKPKAERPSDRDAAPPKEVAALGDATVAALVATLNPNAVQATADASATAADSASDAAATEPGITNVFAAAVAALTDAAEATPDASPPNEPAWQKDTTGASATQVGEKAGGADRKDFVQTVLGANTGTDKGRAVDIPPVPQSNDHPNTTVPAATNAAATAVAHAADPSPVHGTAPAALTRNDESHTSMPTQAVVAGAPVTTMAHVEAAAPTSESAATAPAPPPPPAEQLVAVLRPLQRTADGTYRIRIELRPPELGRVDMRVEVKDGVVHASIHAERAETAELVRNALDDLRARLNADGVRAGSLEVNDGRTNEKQRDQRRQQDIIDEPELVATPRLMTTRPLYQSDALLDVRI
jgi:flagellar hook-length control protein FliK